MADPIGIITSTIEVIHFTVGKINDIREAPERLVRLRTELTDVDNVLQSLETTIAEDNAPQAWRNIVESTKLSAAIKTLKSTCDDFKVSLSKWTRHSDEDRTALRDRIEIARNKTKITLFFEQLDSCKQTVTMALGSCNLQAQLAQMQTTDEVRKGLESQEQTSTAVFAQMKVKITDLVTQEGQLQKTRSEAEDIDEIETIEYELKDVSRARLALNQYNNVCEHVAKQAIASQTGQTIGNVKIAESAYGAIGASNISQMHDVRQEIGNVDMASNSVGFIGMHNNVDHSAMFRARRGG